LTGKQNYLAVYVLVLIAAMALSVGCGGAGDADSVSSAAERDRQLLQETSLAGVRSGYLDASFFVDNETKAVAVQWGAEGPFMRSDGGLQANARLESAQLDGVTLGALLVHDDRTILRLGDRSYHLPAPLPEETSQASSDCQQSLEDIDFGTLVKNLDTRPEPVGETTIEGDLRLPALIAALHRLNARSACGSLLEAAGVSPPALGALETKVKETFKKSEATITFNKDHVLTGISLAMWVESPPPKSEEIDGILTVTLSHINQTGKLGGSSSGKALAARARVATPAQRSAVEGWIGLVDAVLGSLASG
jgi:hypothetical protein